MKIRSMSYLTGEGLKNVWANRMMSIASVGVLTACMIVMGLAMVISKNATYAVHALSQQNVALVWIDSTKTADEAQQVFTAVKAAPNVVEPVYFDKAAGYKKLQEMMGNQYSDVTKYMGDDPSFLPYCIQISFKDTSDTAINTTIANIKKINNVMDVGSSETVTKKINAIQNAIVIGGTWIIILLAIVSLVIVMNTVKITMSNRRREISIMKAVGATNGFIRMPFLVEGMSLGLIAGLVSFVAIYLMYDKGMTAFKTIASGFQFLSFSEMVIPLIIIFAALGIGAGLIGSMFSITRYLRKEGSSFSAIN